MSNICSQHPLKSLEFICYQCNRLMCSRCTINHNKEHTDHVLNYEHIDDIRQSLSSFLLIDEKNNSNNNNSSSDSNALNSTIRAIWKSLKSTSERYQSLSATENEISQHFEQLHQYLVTEEFRLKKPIVIKKDTIVNQIENNIKHLKYLYQIIDINNKLNVNHEKESPNSNQKESAEDTTTQYSTPTIISSISSSSSLQSFIQDNNQTLFNDHHDPFNTDELIKQHNNDSSSLLLDIIHKYNNQFKDLKLSEENNEEEIQISIGQINLSQFNSIIDKLTNLAETSRRAAFIFITHREKNGATLFNTLDSSIEPLKLDYCFRATNSSMVSIGEYIYIFGGWNNPNKWFKFSIVSKSFEHIGEMEGIEGDRLISVCYDGQDHIYLVNGISSHRIDRFNINTLKFEKWIYHNQITGGEHLSTMIFKGTLYSISSGKRSIVEISLSDRVSSSRELDIKPYTACHDNLGNFYIHSKEENRFIKYNVETKKITNLSPIPAKNSEVFLKFHRFSAKISHIFSFGGVEYGNFKYSIEDNQSEQIFQDDREQRQWCGSASI
ncbi:hypothetical protein PPL_08191 [Heterostelium album PN500]|uniref:B box-type domain-containing protein n=1 Tax=Heterostelium pallidum (strain ATCC 26659 / Pp 5 / PN500) TaxID=670386 RepID=D3BIV6_HETP5|nr:hypothetical protein PPL_08191 [Heterostelium album PN500]EFA78730.1 hypothetical protein PPL_08191 [Heterostelium album PN500]|eukprot:XP_020430854.1 hypothetical protein PPL_08191 [Heterostelium album PN500]